MVGRLQQDVELVKRHADRPQSSGCTVSIRCHIPLASADRAVSGARRPPSVPPCTLIEAYDESYGICHLSWMVDIDPEVGIVPRVHRRVVGGGFLV